MRHFIFALPVTASPFCMFEASFRALLITLTRRPQRFTAGCFRAVVRTINLPAITTTADDNLSPAALAEVKPACRFHGWLPSPTTSRQGFKFMKYSPCTRAQHESGHGIGWSLQVWPVSCLFISGGAFLPHLDGFCHLFQDKLNQYLLALILGDRLYKTKKHLSYSKAIFELFLGRGNWVLQPCIGGFGAPFTTENEFRQCDGKALGSDQHCSK
jgi:hypothetical protein